MRNRALCLVLSAGCVPPAYSPPAASPPPPTRHVIRADFDPSAHTRYGTTGDARISGQAFLATRGGEARKAIGSVVVLMPATSYFQEWHEYKIVRSYDTVEIGSKEAARLVRTTRTDGDGNFEFTGLPAGTYYIATTITWEVPRQRRHYTDPIDMGMKVEGGTVFARVTIAPGESKKVVVTRQ